MKGVIVVTGNKPLRCKMGPRKLSRVAVEIPRSPAQGGLCTLRRERTVDAFASPFRHRPPAPHAGKFGPGNNLQAPGAHHFILHLCDPEFGEVPPRLKSAHELFDLK